jgi:translation initiation factor IF-2
MDTEWAAVRLKDMIADIKALDVNVVGCKPVAFVPVSAATGSGIDVLMKAANNLMQQRMHE